MPDVAFVVKDLGGAEDAENLDRALSRVGCVNLVNVDSKKGLVAVSYDGGGAELGGLPDPSAGGRHEVAASPGPDPSLD